MPQLLPLVVAVFLVHTAASQEYDCLVGADKCQNGSSFIYTGNTLECCRAGDFMSSVSTSAFDSTNGGRAVHICKCNSGGVAYINGRPMTQAEKAEFMQGMSAWSTNFQRRMNNLSARLGNMFNGWI